MSLITNWDGSVLIPSNPTNDRTTQLGSFLSIKNINTYYPLPSAYSNLVSTISFYKVPPKYAGRPDLIAAEVYGDAALWWVIFWANSIVDPFARPYVDEVINIIDIQSLKKLLG